MVTLSLTVVFCIIFLGTSHTDDFDPLLQKVPYGPALQNNVHNAIDHAQHVVDRLPNPFGTPAHTPPPEQANSSSGDARWYSDWKWRNPFSSDTTRDEERAVLPPLAVRPPVYTYFDTQGRRKDEQSRQAEQELLLIWRRAWWASGFQPVVLSKSEATNNPLYRRIQGMEVKDAVQMEMMRWLAWSNMNGGILANFLALPMAAYDDPLLSFLRRGEYPALTGYEGLGNGLYVGSKQSVTAALEAALDSPALKSVDKLEDALPLDTMTIDSPPASIAFYSVATLKAKYSPIKELLEAKSVAEAMALLPDLINSHLHTTWRERFPKGISVLKPLPHKSTPLIESAIDIARNLTQCPLTPIPTSCPPNRPKCKPCMSSKMGVSTLKVFRNDSATFTIGVVPHPWTMQTLVKDREDMDLAYIRRKTERDIWIEAATKELLGSGVSSLTRLPSLKNAVATEHGNSQSLWLIAEQETSIEDLDWVFGFKIPRHGDNAVDDGKSETPVPGPERRPPKPRPEYGDGPVPSEAQLERENTLFESARVWLGKQGKEEKEIRGVVEAWNLADTEAWKFVRAWNERRGLERREWERQEKDFVGRGGVLGRWIDRVT